MKTVLLGFVISFLISVIIMPILIYAIKRLKAQQSVLSYVEMHKSKDGTPTMGGLSFILSTVITAIFVFREHSRLATIMMLCFVFFGLIGFLDDFIKVKFKQNLGLTAIQKILAQVAIAVALSVYAYHSELVGSSILLPFINIELDMGIFIVPFATFVILATVNSVNLIDGLDGLCGGVSSVVILVLVVVSILGIDSSYGVYMQEMGNVYVEMGVLLGGIVAFLIYNSKPAKIFMGDTGSLAIGGMIAGFLVLTRQYLLIVLVGIPYVVTAVSVIMQVVYYKLTHKRIFAMAPIHHHFEIKYSESKVVAVYTILTLVVGAIVVMGYM